MSFSVSHVVFNDTFKEIKNYAYENNGNYNGHRIWLHTQYDLSNMIWPYEEDQIEWLNTSLKLFPSLDKDV